MSNVKYMWSDEVAVAYRLGLLTGAAMVVCSRPFFRTCKLKRQEYIAMKNTRYYPTLAPKGEELFCG